MASAAAEEVARAALVAVDFAAVAGLRTERVGFLVAAETRFTFLAVAVLADFGFAFTVAFFITLFVAVLRFAAAILVPLFVSMDPLYLRTI